MTKLIRNNTQSVEFKEDTFDTMLVIRQDGANKSYKIMGIVRARAYFLSLKKQGFAPEVEVAQAPTPLHNEHVVAYVAANSNEEEVVVEPVVEDTKEEVIVPEAHRQGKIKLNSLKDVTRKGTYALYWIHEVGAGGHKTSGYIGVSKNIDETVRRFNSAVDQLIDVKQSRFYGGVREAQGDVECKVFGFFTEEDAYAKASKLRAEGNIGWNTRKITSK